MEQAPAPGAQSCIPSPYLPHILLSCTVCDRTIWVFVKFTKLNERESMPFEWIGTIPTEYQPHREDSVGKSPSFLQLLPQVLQGRAYTIKLADTLLAPVSWGMSDFPLLLGESPHPWEPTTGGVLASKEGGKPRNEAR